MIKWVKRKISLWVFSSLLKDSTELVNVVCIIILRHFGIIEMVILRDWLNTYLKKYTKEDLEIILKKREEVKGFK
jgi:hypothetical protein